MARPAQAIRQLAHHLHAHAPLGQVGRAGARLRAVAARADRADQARSRVAGLHQRQGASGRDRRAKKNGPQAIGKSRGGWNTKIHLVAADARTAITFSLSPGQAHDAPEGRELLKRLGKPNRALHLLMDRAYEGNETRQLALDLGYTPVVPPLSTRLQPWEYDREMYKRRNEVERLFRRLKGYRRIFSRFEKLDVMFLAFICFALIADALR
ncbi:IS5 family transposase [Roseateles sp.]|uniref:IS5 family transposase n=1 Tax=Roseateles sp. TaxID=1971397 RepID=UPI002DFCBC1C|nr:IS5 family transposase [Roseateles sp.]HEV6967401.1 IS5 family transposase [Roseateles sp.]